MPEEALLQRFERVVLSTREPAVRRYLDEARRCFAAEAYNGAVVMAWNAVMRYLREAVERISVSLFQQNCRALYPKEDLPRDLRDIRDGKFIEACKRMGLLPEVAGLFVRERECRNACAHADDFFASADEAARLAESVQGVVSRRLADERLTKMGVLCDFAKSAGEREGKAVAAWVHENLCPQLAHALLTAYLDEDEVADASGIVGLWRGLWSRIDGVQRGHLWERLLTEVRKSVLEEEKALRNPQELACLIVWPPVGEAHPARDAIAELYLAWFERLLREDDIRAADPELARSLREHLPLRTRLQSILEEMVRRRYVE